MAKNYVDLFEKSFDDESEFDRQVEFFVEMLKKLLEYDKT